MSRDFDVILYGVTGFTGRQTVQYFQKHCPPTVKWAIAARNGEKLTRLAEELGLPDSVERIAAEASDTIAIKEMVRRSRVLLTTAGPYARFGTNLIAACCRNGTHYVDITGETWWVRDMLDRYDSDARISMAKIIPFCGFDSIPSDITTFLAHQRMRDSGDETLSARGYFEVSGGFNGGTLHSGLNMYDAGAEEQAANPSLLLPSRSGGVRPAPDPDGAYFDSDVLSWVAPFFMGMINSRVVHRSAALAFNYGESYGSEFSYQEFQKLGGLNPLPALGVATALGTFRNLGKVEVFRKLASMLGPAPGEGPSEKAMNAGYSAIEVVARGKKGTRVRAKLAVDGDPGNRATVLFACEAALCIATSEAELPGGPTRVGFLTPATGLGLRYVERLKAAGVRISVDA